MFGVLVECSEGGVCCQGMTESVQKRIAKACSGRYVEGRRGTGRKRKGRRGTGRKREGRRGTGRKRKAILRITQIGDSASAMEEKKIPL